MKIYIPATAAAAAMRVRRPEPRRVYFIYFFFLLLHRNIAWMIVFTEKKKIKNSRKQIRAPHTRSVRDPYIKYANVLTGPN